MPAGAGPWGNGGFGGGSSAALTAFDCEAGDAQLRVAGLGFALGSARAGRRWRAAPGDYVEVVQTADWAAEVLRAVVYVRPPPGPAGGVAWAVEVRVDGVLVDRFTFSPGDPARTRVTVGARGAAFGPTPHAVSFRLTLYSAPLTPVSVPPPHPSPRVVLTVAGATNPAHPLPVVLSFAAPHGLAEGDSVLVAGVLGCTAANGYRRVTPVPGDPLRLSLDGSLGDGDYTGGPGTCASPPHPPVTTSTGLTSEVELPLVRVVSVAEDSS